MAACVDHTVHAKRHHHTLLFLRYPTQTQCTAASRLGDLHQQFQVHRDLKKKKHTETNMEKHFPGFGM